jgi:hypothetical protein
MVFDSLDSVMHDQLHILSSISFHFLAARIEKTASQNPVDSINESHK